MGKRSTAELKLTGSGRPCSYSESSTSSRSLPRWSHPYGALRQCLVQQLHRHGWTFLQLPSLGLAGRNVLSKIRKMQGAESLYQAQGRISCRFGAVCMAVDGLYRRTCCAGESVCPRFGERWGESLASDDRTVRLVAIVWAVGKRRLTSADGRGQLSWAKA